MKIAFVSLPAYPIVAPGVTGIFGGTETRAVTLAEGMAKYSSHEMTFLARHPQLIEPHEINNVTWTPWRDYWTEKNARIAAAFRRSKRFPYLSVGQQAWQSIADLPLITVRRLLIPSSHTPFQCDDTLANLDVDLFCPFGVHSASAKVIHNAHLRGRKAILFLGSDADVDPRYTEPKRFRNEYGERSDVCLWCLREADAIVAQNERQRDMLKQHFQRESFLLNNPIDIEAWQAGLQRDSDFDLPFDPYVLWIGRADNFSKRADWAVEIARLLPEIPFVMVMNPKQDEVEQAIRKHCPDNVHLIRQVPFAQIPRLFASAKLLLNTSPQHLEGLPNAFLQAGASSVPIVSTEAAATFIEQAQCGVVADGSTVGTAKRVREIWEHDRLHEELGQSGHSYVRTHHDVPVVCEALEQILGGFTDQYHQGI